MKAMPTTEILGLARKHLPRAYPMFDQARLCIIDAEKFAEAGNDRWARTFALRALALCVGIWHRDYEAATHGERS